MRQRCLFNTVMEILAIAVMQEKEWLRQEEIKLSLFADDVIVYIESPKGLQVSYHINEFNKIAGLKIIYYKLYNFSLYTNKQFESKIF